MFNDTCWVANVSDGSTHTERWLVKEPSPWNRLMTYCQKNNVYVTNLRMTLGTQTVGCPSNAIGYWQANAMPSIQGIECDEELHKWHGIGWVDAQSLTVNIIWGALDPATHHPAFWNDSRTVEGQNQIIWAKKELSLVPRDPEAPLPKSDAVVAGMREYTRKIGESQ